MCKLVKLQFMAEDLLQTLMLQSYILYSILFWNYILTQCKKNTIRHVRFPLWADCKRLFLCPTTQSG